MHLGSVLTSSTTMTLDARFTMLRRGESLYEDGGGAASGCTAMGSSRTSRAEAVASATVRNRRLAVQMSRRPAVVAALNRGGSRSVANGIINRLGGGGINSGEDVGTFRSSAAFAANTFRRRSSSASRIRGGNANGGGSTGFRRGGGRRGGNRGGGNNRLSRPMSRSNSVNRMQRSGSLGRLSRAGSMSNLSRSGSLNRLGRSQSLQSLSGWANNSFRGRGIGRGRRRGRGRRGAILQGFVARRRDSFGRIGRGGATGGGGQNRPFRGRNNFRGRNLSGGGQRNFRGSRNNYSSKFRGGGRGGSGGGRGFRGGRGGKGSRGGAGGNRGRQKEQVPTKEALDMEIDEYMSTTKSHLDKEIESYMNQPAEDGVVNPSQTNDVTVTSECWD